MERQLLPLQQVALLLKRGISPKYADDGVLVVNQRCIRDGRLTFDVARRHDLALRKVPEDRFLRLWDVVVNSTGVGTLGRVAQLTAPPEEPMTIDSHVTVVRPDPSLVDGRFFGYVLRERQHQIEGMGEGATGQTELSRTRLGEELLIDLPSLDEQRKIAAVLAAYDELIENNLRRIKILEEMAQAVYREWFVNFRFPGYEDVTIVDGVPEGWESKSAIDAMDVLSGGTPKTTVRDYWDGGIPFFTPKDATDHVYAFSTERTLTEEGLRNCSSNLYPKDTAFITARGTVGKINLAQTDMAMNQSCYALVAKPPINQHYLYFALREGVEQFRSRASGAVFDTIVRDTFQRIPFTVPNRTLVRLFSDHASPILRQIEVLSSENRNLRTTRDLLLPKLVSGEIDVSDLDIDTDWLAS